MAIKNIPEISGPNFGGVIYGLSTQIGYSSAPTKLILDIVNERGVYSTPVLNQQVSVSFGSFNFNGVVWSYDLKESAEQKTLQVTLVDNSIILDRLYVLLWKRGLLNELGQQIIKEKTFDFSDESILVPKKNTRLSGFPFTEFVEKKLGVRKETMRSRAIFAKRIGDILLVGREKFANSDCDIPDTYYTFNDLRSILPVSGALPNNSEWKATHEGTLREVLSSWASDLGFDFYWDFSSNQLIFFSVSHGISSVPNVTAPNIISKEVSESLEGTFRQYGIGYTQIPRSALKTIGYSKTIPVSYQVNPYSLDYFLRKIGAPQSIEGLRQKWGGNRNLSQFRQAAFLGFVSRSLRDLYCFQNQHWTALGYQNNTEIQISKEKIISFLKKNGFQDMVGDLETFDAKGLPNYQFSFISRDPTLADKWNDIEQTLLGYHGRFYRIPDSSGSFFYCNANYTIEIDISVDPEGTTYEDNNFNFAGRKIFDRNGQMSHDSASAQEALGYEKLSNDIENCAPIHIDLKATGLQDEVVNSRLLTPQQSNLVNTLLIYPKSGTFVRNKIGFNSSTSKSNHPLEQTYIDVKNSNIQNGKKNCTQFEDKLKRGSCEAVEERARNKAIEDAGGATETGQNQDDLISGLVSKSAYSCNISLKNGGNVRIHAPSDSSYQVICRYTVNVNKISSVGTEEFLWSSGSPGFAGAVAEIRVSTENVTDPDEDSFRKRRNSIVPKPVDIDGSTPSRTIKYVYAGAPQGVALSPSRGLSSLDISLSSDGFTTTATFSSKPPKPAKADNTVRKVHSQFNRASFNAS